MRVFTAQDGKRWIAKIHDGHDAAKSGDGRTGWEVVEFDSEQPGSYQKITYRPAGWLNHATIQELIAALQEAETVRASWK